MKKLVKEIGNWVSGDRFWNRDIELKLLHELLVEGAHVLLVAPRRVGKTSLMRECARRIEDRHYCVFLDVQHCRGPQDALVQLTLETRELVGLWERTQAVFRNALGAVDELGIDELSVKLRGSLVGDWSDKGSRLMRALASGDKPVILFVDELPIMLVRMMRGEGTELEPGGVHQVELFMSWLRRMTIEHRGRIRFVVAGSIGIEPVLRRVGLSATLNTFSPFELEPWSQATGIACLQALGQGYGIRFEEGVLRRMVERLGVCVPHHVQMYFGHVYASCRRQGLDSCSLELVDEVYAHSMLASRGHAELFHLEERLKLVLGLELLPLALDLLTEAAVEGRLSVAAAGIICSSFFQEPGEGSARLRHVMDILVHDGYLRREREGWVFVSSLVWDWWRGRFEMGYVPVKGRH